MPNPRKRVSSLLKNNPMNSGRPSFQKQSSKENHESLIHNETENKEMETLQHGPPALARKSLHANRLFSPFGPGASGISKEEQALRLLRKIPGIVGTVIKSRNCTSNTGGQRRPGVNGRNTREIRPCSSQPIRVVQRRKDSRPIEKEKKSEQARNNGEGSRRRARWEKYL